MELEAKRKVIGSGGPMSAGGRATSLPSVYNGERVVSMVSTTRVSRPTTLPRAIATVVVEQHLLLREGLASLIGDYSFRLTGSGTSAAEVIADNLNDEPGLILLGAGSFLEDRILSEVNQMRDAWPKSKIVLLCDKIPLNCQQLLNSGIDGCVALCVSREIFIRALEIVMVDDARVVVFSSEGEKNKINDSNGFVREGLPEQVNQFSESHLVPDSGQAQYDMRNHLQGKRARGEPKLSNREIRILDELVRGHANKVIARRCNITEATVKVHIKSILRKIKVANRTQAAVWAIMETTDDETRNRLLRIDGD
jgi:two-component system nitrate/nitrite response regulator NarL